MSKNVIAEARLKEIDIELETIHKLFAEYHSWYDKTTQKVWFPPGRYFDYEKIVEHEYKLLQEREHIKKRLENA